MIHVRVSFYCYSVWVWDALGELESELDDWMLISTDEMLYRKGWIMNSRISVSSPVSDSSFFYLSCQYMSSFIRDSIYVLPVTHSGSKNRAPLSNDADNRAYQDPQAVQSFRFPVWYWHYHHHQGLDPGQQTRWDKIVLKFRYQDWFTPIKSQGREKRAQSISKE